MHCIKDSCFYYASLRDANLTCNLTLTRVSLIYRTEPATKKWKKLKRKKTGMLRSIDKQSLEFVESWRWKGRLRWEGLAEKECFKPGMKERVGDGLLIIININVSITTMQSSIVKCFAQLPSTDAFRSYLVTHYCFCSPILFRKWSMVCSTTVCSSSVWTVNGK